MIAPVPPIGGQPLPHQMAAALPAGSAEKATVKQNLLIAGQTVPLVHDTKSTANEDLKRAFKQLDEDAKRRKKPFKYVLDEEAQVIKVVDLETGEVIRVIPAGEAISIASGIEGATGAILQIKA